MIPVTQTKLHSSNVSGNCMAAAFASIMELSIEKVPAFEDMALHRYLNQVFRFVHQHGYDMFVYGYDPMFLDEPYLAIGHSPRMVADNDLLTHMVVWQAGQLLFDPHPDRTGLAGDPLAYWVLQKADSNKETFCSVPAVSQ